MRFQNNTHKKSSARIVKHFYTSATFMKTITFIPFAALLITTGLVGCLPYKIDTVDFQQTSSSTSSKSLAPKIHIDNNMSITSPFGGFIKSNKPYSIGVDHTDMTFTIAALEITKVNVTYKDGTTDPRLAAIKLPMRIASKHHVAINSGGPPPNYTFETPMRLIVGRIPKVISRDEPVTLNVEGRFIKDNGRSIPFKIRQSYKPEFEKSVQSWVEVISGV